MPLGNESSVPLEVSLQVVFTERQASMKAPLHQLTRRKGERTNVANKLAYLKGDQSLDYKKPSQHAISAYMIAILMISTGHRIHNNWSDFQNTDLISLSLILGLTYFQLLSRILKRYPWSLLSALCPTWDCQREVIMTYREDMKSIQINLTNKTEKYMSNSKLDPTLNIWMWYHKASLQCTPASWPCLVYSQIETVA